MSIPIFAEPPTHAAPHLQWRIENEGGRVELVGVNDGNQHETIRDIAIAAPGGASPKVENGSPYILPGVSRRWRIITSGTPPMPGTTLRLTAHSEAGNIDQAVPVIAGR